jgi:transcriptional regulator PpsR
MVTLKYAITDDVVGLVKSLKKSIGSLDGEFASRLISSSMDVALVLDKSGVVQDYSVSDDILAREQVFTSIVGKPWVGTVTVESRIKVEEMLRDANAKGPPRWRQVNHPSATGADLPVRYSALALGSSGKILAVGRELRSQSQLQQRLVNAQQSMEREYARLRLAETRYRLLFQTASEAVVIADAHSGRILEINPAAEKLFAVSPRRKVVKSLFEALEGNGGRDMKAMFEQIRSAGHADPLRATLVGGKTAVTISGSLFRQDATAYVLVRIGTISAELGARNDNPSASKLKQAVERMPDAFVMIGKDRRIQTANFAFLELVQRATEEQVRDEPLDRWLGRSSVEIETFLGNTAQHGSARQFATIVRGEFGSIEEVEASAVFVADPEHPCFGLTIRANGRKAAAKVLGEHELPRSVQQMTGLVGQVPLKNLVRETTDLIERLCIEAALELVGDNRASAAEMLGLSRQSLYVKLRRYGLGDLGGEE